MRHTAQQVIKRYHHQREISSILTNPRGRDGDEKWLPVARWRTLSDGSEGFEQGGGSGLADDRVFDAGFQAFEDGNGSYA
jgi:hypothetical protein